MSSMTDRESGEEGFLRWLAATSERVPELLVPPGDDAAVWSLGEDRSIVLAADAVAEGTHFRPGEDPLLIGRKALAVNLSDLAAMGAEPLCALATCSLPHGFDPALPRRLVEGIRELGSAHHCPLVGGDTIYADGPLSLSVTVIGSPLPGGPVLRSGGRAGDLLGLTGALGGSLRGRHLRFVPRLAEARRLLELGPPSAMMDVSDGLLLDLHRLADACGLGFRLRCDDLPVHPDAGWDGRDPLQAALSDGEDFELLVAAPKEVLARMRDEWNLETPLTIIGELIEGETRTMIRKGVERPAPRKGHVHR